ncbi:hypothetical protein [Flavobacterium sp.]|uniref:hypothetical protein n=1 Tax=Flavobacterium sp. TaxID=239 RepID=UPI0028BF4C7C|nr:hypothetical protein [Flavobacterium sp.]
MSLFSKFFIFGFTMFLLSCSSGKTDEFASRSQLKCITRLIEKDDKIGKIRNKQCETLSLSQTILNYTEAMKSISADACPDAFVVAYESHRKAWIDMLPITDQFPAMRGEMHVLFKQLEQSDASVAFKKQLAKIWATWAEVEKFVPKK